jgi:nicotinamidase-related amidase
MVTRQTLEGTALLLVDIQYDFIDGSLAVPGAIDIIRPVTELLAKYDFDVVAVSQDYHPAGHISFASSHPDDGPGPFKEFNVAHPIAEKARQGEKVKQMLWPDHCIQGTHGADLHVDVKAAVEEIKCRGRLVHLVQKGTEKNVDGYSAFADNQYLGFTDLARVLHSNSVRTLIVVGLATDYCVKSSAIDACKFKFNTILIEETMRGVASDTTQASLRELKGWGARVISSVAQIVEAVT